MNFEDELVTILINFRDNIINDMALRKWVTNNECDLKALLGKPGLILKINNGDRKAVTSVIAQYSGSGKTDFIYKEGPFKYLTDFECCETAIAMAVSNGTLKKVPQPHWFQSSTNEIGAAEFYESIGSKSVWNLTIPERASREHWKK